MAEEQQPQQSQEGSKQKAEEPNVIFSKERVYELKTKDGEEEKITLSDKPTATDKIGKLKFGNPPEKVEIGMMTIQLPAPEMQLQGFCSKNAMLLVTNIPGFKSLKPKGE